MNRLKVIKRQMFGRAPGSTCFANGSCWPNDDRVRRARRYRRLRSQTELAVVIIGVTETERRKAEQDPEHLIVQSAILDLEAPAVCTGGRS